MADQASVKAGGDAARGNGSAPEGLVGGIAEFGNDVLTLAELQAKLTVLDLKESVAMATVPALLAAAGLALAMAALPVFLGGVALVLASLLGIQPGWALVLVGGVVLVASAAVAAFAARRVGGSFASLQRSTEELTRNISWIRTVLVHSGRAARGRRF